MRRSLLLSGSARRPTAAPPPTPPATQQITRWSDAWLATSGGLTLPESKSGFLKIRFKQAAEFGTGRILRLATGSVMNLSSDSFNDGLYFHLRDSATQYIVDIVARPGTNWVAAGLWHTLAISWDVTLGPNPADRVQAYWDDSPVATLTINTAADNGNNVNWSRNGNWEFMSGNGTVFFGCDYEYLVIKPGTYLNQAALTAIDHTNLSTYEGAGTALVLRGDAASANGGTFEKGGVGTFTKQVGTVINV